MNQEQANRPRIFLGATIAIGFLLSLSALAQDFSIGNPSGNAHQKWTLIPKENNFYVIRPSYSPSLVLAAAGGETKNGTAIVLETENGKPSQMWLIKRNPNGSFSLLPKRAPEKGLDNFGGGKNAGAKQDLRDYQPEDEHLQWILKPLDGARCE